MKNVTCRKLLIDRQKAPENLGTLKDITLYGSFEFQNCGGKNNNNNKQISIKKNTSSATQRRSSSRDSKLPFSLIHR